MLKKKTHIKQLEHPNSKSPLSVPQNPDALPSNESERDTQIGQSAFSFIPQLQRLLENFFEDGESKETQVPAPAALLNRLKHRELSTEAVDEALLDGKLEDIGDLATTLLEDEVFGVFPAKLNEKISRPYDRFPWADWTDAQRCIGELLLSLVDELAGLALTCSRHILSQLLTGLAEFVGGLKESRLGLPFGVYAICSDILPILQKWARREHNGFLPSAQTPQSLRNLKQATTIFTELAADYVRADAKSEWTEKLVGDVLLLFDDLLSHASPFVAGTGSACLGHFVVSLGGEFSERSMADVVRALWKAA